MLESEQAAIRRRRHIPSHDPDGMTGLSFHEALADALRPNGRYDVARWLFVPNEYREWRYILGTRGSRPLICAGINPSTAAPDALDPTLQSVQRIALNNGYDAFLMFNVCAQRATLPKDRDRTLNPALHRENMEAFRYLLSLSPAPAVWAAWGNIITTRPYLTDCVRDMAEAAAAAGAAWLCCGPLSKKGHPHHPLYLKADEPLRPFDMEAWLRNQK